MNTRRSRARGSSRKDVRRRCAGAACLCLALLGSTGSARAQACFEVQGLSAGANVPESIAAGDIDGDGDLDLVTASPAHIDVTVWLNRGSASFARGATYPTSSFALSAALEDLDQDGDVDLAVATYSSGVKVFWNSGAGVLVPGPALPTGLDSRSMVLVDFDSDGRIDIATANQGGGSVSVIRNAGGGAFLPQLVLSTTFPWSLTAGDVDGDADADLVVVKNSGGVNNVVVFLNLGGGAFSPPVGHGIGSGCNAVTMLDADSDGDLDLALAEFWTDSVIVAWNDGTGAFPTISFHGTWYSPEGIVAADMNSDGIDDLVVGWSQLVSLAWCPLSAGGGASISLPWSDISALVARDFDSDGDVDLAAADSSLSQLVILRNCSTSGVVTCTGEPGSPCPCGNFSPPGSGAGCLNALGTAGTLRATGSARLASDGLVLAGTGMTNSVALFIQGTSASAGGAGTVFGDGLRCATGTIVRLALETNSGGSSSYPGAGEPSVATRGGVNAPGERVYQVWYRDAASFCQPATFNLTNGLRVEWHL